MSQWGNKGEKILFAVAMRRFNEKKREENEGDLHGNVQWKG